MLPCSEVGSIGGYSGRNQLPPQTNPKLTWGRTLCSSLLSYQENYNSSSDGEGARAIHRAGFYGHIVTCWKSTAAPGSQPLALAPWRPLLFPCEVSFLLCEEQALLRFIRLQFTRPAVKCIIGL